VRNFRKEFTEMMPYSYSESFSMEMIDQSYAIVDQYSLHLNEIKREAAQNT